MTNDKAVKDIVKRIKLTAKKLNVHPSELTLVEFLINNTDITPWYVRKYGHFNTIKKKFIATKTKQKEDKEMEVVYKVAGVRK